MVDHMQFRRYGHVYKNNKKSPLQQHFAILPTPIVIPHGIRIFYASTDTQMNGRIFSIDVDQENPTIIIRKDENVALDVGREGCFDQNGVNPLCLVVDGDRLRLYYAGYNRSRSTPYTLFSGVAVSDDFGISFRRIQDEPVLPPLSYERYFRTALHVRRWGEKWQGWYIGGDHWIDYNGKRLPIYGLKYCESEDGLHWGNSRTILTPNVEKGEIGFGRPYVVDDIPGTIGMFISIRTVDGYNQCYMESHDNMNWEMIKRDIIPSGQDTWDSQGTSYGAYIKAGEKEFLFYNGNNMGRTGFGVAIREK